MKKRILSLLLSFSLFSQCSLVVSATDFTITIAAEEISTPSNSDETVNLEDDISNEISDSLEVPDSDASIDSSFSEENTIDTDAIKDVIESQEQQLAEELNSNLSEEITEQNIPVEIEEKLMPADEAALATSEINDNALMALQSSKEALTTLLSGKTVSALVYLCDYYDLREDADEESSAITALPSGQLVFIRDVALDDLLNVWYQVSCFIDDVEYNGYIRKEYLAYSDEDFLTWEQNYPLNYSLAPLNLQSGMSDVSQFPASYQQSLITLKNAHPNWVFVKMNTNLDWNYVINNEDYKDRSLISSSSPSSWKNGDSGQSGWSIASRGIICYYMDPRNFLNDPHIFQFEQLTYNASYHTQSAVQKILDNTFMSGQIPNDGRTYSQVFTEIGSLYGVSPFHLACRVYQEQGATGTSPLISGTYGGYEGLYNYFNIGATGSNTTAVIQNGLSYAKNKGWTSRYASLKGGADILSANYIRKGQDTLYLQKFDVDNSSNGMFWHQYMQNIAAPASESSNIRKAYNNTNALNNPFVFKIPVYNNMPASPCPQPVDYVFSDIDVIEGNWKYESVNYVYERGIMTGISGTTLFQPDEPLTRAMFATILYRSAGSPGVNYTSRFSDVVNGKWYSSAIIWAYNKGIVSGYNDGSNRFGINDFITREQIAKMLYEYASLQGYDISQRQSLSTYTDSSEISHWATEYMRWAVGCGMIGGKPNEDGTARLDPRGNATRAECAAMLMRFLTKYAG